MVEIVVVDGNKMLWVRDMSAVGGGPSFWSEQGGTVSSRRCFYKIFWEPQSAT